MAAALALTVACSGDAPDTPASVTISPDPENPAVIAQTQNLLLRVDSPETSLVTGSDQVTISGIASPDATLSVNGRLALPDDQGRFSISLQKSDAENPLSIEIIATSLTGETESLVRSVIFSIGQGYYGAVTSVAESEITVNTDAGPVSFLIDSSTAARIAGWESASVPDIALGTAAAALTEGDKVVSILALSNRPVKTRHFTGMVLSSETGETLTLQDNTGKQVTATAAVDISGLTFQELVTAVLEQDLASGALTVTAVDRASESARRLFAALELSLALDGSLASDNLSALRWRLAEHSAGHLSILSALDAGSLAAAKQLYSQVLTKHRAGKPSADITGMVTSMNSATRQITVQLEQGGPVTVRIAETTPVALFGERVRSGQLDLASRVSVRYELDSGDASKVSVLAGNTLQNDVGVQLAQAAEMGEVLGTLLKIGQWGASVTIREAVTGQQSTLDATGASVSENGRPAELTGAMEGRTVVARFDPESFQLLEMESLHLGAGEELLSGVVHSFIPKVTEGNLTIRTVSGQLRSFTHNPKSLIRRDGLQVSIDAVRVGDLVRPNTRIRSLDNAGGQAGEIVALNLKAPEPGLVTGIIRGVSSNRSGDVRVTVSNIWLELISLKVGPDTAISQQGQTMALQDLAVGQEVTYGSYDLVTLVARRLKLDPPRVAVRAAMAR